LSSAGKKTARFLLAEACDSYVPYFPYVRCVGWKPRLNICARYASFADLGVTLFGETDLTWTKTDFKST